MPSNLSAYSFDNPINLCDLGACFNVASGALTTGALDPQTGQTRDGGYSPPPISLIYTPQVINGTDSISLDSYLSEASTVSVNLNTLSTCINVATGYDMFNFGYQLLIEEKGLVLVKVDTFNYNNTFNIVCSSSFVTNWQILSGAATYNKETTALSGTGIDLLPVGTYINIDSPYDTLTVKYYLPKEESAPPVFWPGELLNVYETKKIVWDSSNIRLGGENLKNTFIPLNVNETTYVVDLPRDLSLYTINDYISTRTDVTLSGVQVGNTIVNYNVGNQHFGEEVDTNDDGTRIVASVPFYQYPPPYFPIARAYQLIDSSWIKIGQDLLGDVEGGGDYYGESVSINSDGSRIAVGLGTGIGVTKIYELSGSQWVQIGQSIIGASVSQSGFFVRLNSIGNRIVIAERGNSSLGFAGSSQVRVFEYNGSSWVLMGQIIPGVSNEGGISIVDINSVGDIIAFGSPYSVGGRGTIRVFSWDGSQWNQLGEDIVGDETNDGVGLTLSLNSSGNIVGTSTQNGGALTDAVLVYKWDNTSWNQLGNTIEVFGSIYGGDSLSLNYIGDRLAVGSYLNYYTNAVEVYEYNGTYWEKIIVDIRGPYDETFFGTSVALNKVGDKLTVGSPLFSGGQVVNYELPPYPLLSLSSYSAYKSVMLWSDGYITENPFEDPFTIPDGTYNDSAGVINFRRFTSSGEYTILSNTFYYRNAIGKEIILTEPYNITFVVS